MKLTQGAFTLFCFHQIFPEQVYVFRKQKYIQEEKEKAMYEEDMFTR